MDLGAYKPRPWPVYFSRGIATISARLRVPDLPGPGIRQGHPVKVSGLVAQPWTMADRFRVIVRAARSSRGRATSMPFTAVLTGPQRTTTDNTMAAMTCPSSHIPRYRPCLIWLWEQVVGRGLHWPCHARLAEPVLVAAQGRSAGGVRDQTGPLVDRLALALLRAG